MELTQYLAIARRWWWLLVLATVIGGGAAYGASQLVTPTYRATVTLLVVVQQESGIVGLADVQASEQLASTFTELVTVRPVLVAAIERGELTLSPDELEERLSVESPSATQLLEITAEASTAGSARDIANVVAETFIDLNQTVLSSRRGLLTVVEPAVAPLEPSAPSLTLNTVLGAVLALAATATIIGLVEYLDDTVKNEETVARLTGLPVVGHVARFARRGKPADALRAAIDPQSREAEAYRSIRTSVTFSVGSEQRIRRLLVTSPGPREGKSVTAANLAVVFALAGSRIALVDANLRRPVQHQIFGVANTSGLTNLLVSNSIFIEQVVQQTAYDRVWLLPSGPLPANPSELLGSGRMYELLHALERQFDIVILDSPPLLAVSDAAAVSSMVSASVVVVQQAKTRSKELRTAVERLAMAGRPIAGVVLNLISGSQHQYHPDYQPTRVTTARQRGRGPRRAAGPAGATAGRAPGSDTPG